MDESHKLKRRVNLGTQFKNYDDVNRELGLPEQATQMDWILKLVKLPIFFYDPLQSIGPSCLGRDAMKRALGKAADNPIKLESQMRVRGGDVYLRYIQDVLDGAKTIVEPSKDTTSFSMMTSRTLSIALSATTGSTTSAEWSQAMLGDGSLRRMSL